MKLALSVEKSNGSGSAMEMRSSAFAGRAASQSGVTCAAPNGSEGLENESPASTLWVSAGMPACSRAVADARSS